MTQSIPEILDVNREYKQPYGLKAEKTVHRVTFNPSSANPGETLYIHIPKLTENVVYVPGSIALIFKLTLAASGHVNNTVVNNLAKVLKFHMRVMYGGETLQDTHRIDLFETYHDLFMNKRDRDNKLREGISSENMRKLRTSAGDKSTSDAKEVSLANIYGDKYRMPKCINHPILDNHGVFYAKTLSNSLSFEITLPQSNEVVIIITSDLTKNYNYGLTNIELEYECITSDYLAREATSAYQIGKVFYYENILLHKTFTIAKATDSVINEHINIPRRSMSGILMLFTEAYAAGARDSEKFISPSITQVNVNVDGLPNKLYSKGMVPFDFWDAIRDRMGETDNVTAKDFYSDKFALWIDLRTCPDNAIHGNGLMLNSTKDGIKLEMKRKVSGSGTITCHIFVISDAVMEIKSSSLKSILY